MTAAAGIWEKRMQTGGSTMLPVNTKDVRTRADAGTMPPGFTGRTDADGRVYDAAGRYQGRTDKSVRRYDASGRYLGREDLR